MTANPAPPLPELVRDSKLETTTFQRDLTIHTQPLGRRRRTEIWRRGELLGHGGYGVVWLEHKVDGDDDAAGRRAVKVVRNRGGPGHYVRELEALAKFSQDKYSDFFVKFLGWYENPESNYLHIAMEYCPHGDLKKHLVQNGGRLPENEVKDIASQVLAGVVMMHRAGFANRDIKPANILIKSKPPNDWWVKVCDFGLSKRAEGLTFASTTVRGTPEFMPPEMLGFSTDPARTDSFMVDMWCLGETIFQALTGQPVFGMPAAVGRYLHGSLGFPVHVLQRAGASSEAASFIVSLMSPWPQHRMTGEAAVRHPWMYDMALEAAVRAPETPGINQSGGVSYQYPSPSPSGRAPGDQLTQASGQWTTTMALPNQPPPQQQGRFGRGHLTNFRPVSEAQRAQSPYYTHISPPTYPQLPSYLNENPFFDSPYSNYNRQNPYVPRYHVSQPNLATLYPPPSSPPYSAFGIPYKISFDNPRMTLSDPSIVRAGSPIPPLVRRKTKAIDASKCSILSHIKTIKQPPGRLWDDNAGLRPSYDTLPTFRHLQDDEKPDSTIFLTYREYFERQPFR